MFWEFSMLGGCNDKVYVTEWLHTGGRDSATREIKLSCRSECMAALRWNGPLLSAGSCCPEARKLSPASVTVYV